MSNNWNYNLNETNNDNDNDNEINEQYNCETFELSDYDWEPTETSYNDCDLTNNDYESNFNISSDDIPEMPQIKDTDGDFSWKNANYGGEEIDLF